MRFKFIDILLYTLLFVFIVAFPVDLFQIDDIYKVIIQIGLRVLLIGFYIYIIVKNKIKIFNIFNVEALLCCAPFILACFSNMIATQINGTYMPSNMGGDLLAANIILSLLVAVSEEILFRLFIHNSLTKVTSFPRILASAGIFALMHLVNLANVRSVDALLLVLLQVFYNFGLGLMLGFLYEFSHSLTASIVLHFGFNLCNQVLFSFYGMNPDQLTFYLTAVVIAVVLIAYASIIYFCRFKKFDRYFRS